MATISTSHSSRTRYLLRLTDNAGDAVTRTYCLYANGGLGHELDLAEDGVVHERAKYRVSFLSEDDLGRIRIVLRVNGEESFKARANVGGLVSYEGGSYHSYSLTFDDEIDAALFRMTYGFASIEVDFSSIGSGSRMSLWTKDIPCVCEHEGQRRAVEGMISELAEGAGSKAMGWMLSPMREEQARLALVEGSSVSDSSRSLRAFLALCESTINTYEANLSFFRARAHSRAIKHDEIVPTRSVRRLGRKELSWIARTPEVVHETSAQTALSVNERYYFATEVQTERVRKSYNNLENRAICAFIVEVFNSMSRVIDSVKDEMSRLEAIAEKLKAIDLDGGLLPSLVIVEACLGHEEPLSSKAAALRKRAISIARSLRQAMPEVEEKRYRLPRRTKVFQEVRPYREIYYQMQRWSDFGDLDLLCDGFALSTWKMDKLYEYYVLFKLLDQIEGCGYSPSANEVLPLRSVSYGLKSRFYSDEIQVANFYRFQEGENQLTLLYEPVLYGDSRDEALTGLHRTTRVDPFEDNSPDSYWRPDYLIVLETPERSVRYVVDAKFRTVQDVKSGQRGASEFDKCLIKYKVSLASKGGAVDAVWLICGRGITAQTCVYENSSWALDSELRPDGITLLGPGVGKLDEMFELLGLSGGAPAVSDEISGSSRPEPVSPVEAAPVESHVLYDASVQEDRESQDDRLSAVEREREPEGKEQPAVEQFETGERDSAPVLQALPDAAGPAQKTESEDANVEPVHADDLPAAKASKPQKKAKGQVKRKVVDQVVLEQIRAVCTHMVDKANLTKSEFASRTFGLERPMLRLGKPNGREAKFYSREKVLIDGAEYYVCMSWNAVQKIKLAKYVKSLEEKLNEQPDEGEGSVL